ncbi:hypothetical protein [Micromonospora sp. CPCC 206061]|uniref:hypothetical protein n=1 Tax=Micromonospora sp. CPCC 206061 TaxID=3122410 RepID=UPI002FF412BC
MEPNEKNRHSLPKTGGTMPQENDIPAAVDYPGTVETRPGNNGTERTEPTVLVELVVVDGPEGQKLHAAQGEVVYRILTSLAEKNEQTLQEENRL